MQMAAFGKADGLQFDKDKSDVLCYDNFLGTGSNPEAGCPLPLQMRE